MTRVAATGDKHPDPRRRRRGRRLTPKPRLSSPLPRLLGAALVLLSLASTVRAEALLDVVRKTLTTNPEVLIEVARKRAANEGLSRARAGYFPQVELQTGTGKEEKRNSTTETTYQSLGGQVRQDRRDVSLTLSQMLFDGFSTSSEVKRNEFRVEAAAHKVAASSEQTALRAIEAYLEVLRQQEVLALTQENLLSHERTLDQIQQRVSGGFARPSDLDQIRARVALAKANLTTAEANREVATINYKLVVGDVPGKLERPAPPDVRWLPTEADTAVQMAIDANNLLHSARADVEAAGAQRSSARAAFSPRLSLEMGKQRSFFATPLDAPRDLTLYAMVRLRYNLFAGGADMARVGESLQLENEAREVLNRAERQLEQSVRLSWNAYRSARDRLPNLRQHSESSRLTRDAYTKQFALGQRSLLDMLDSENEFFTAQTNFLNGQFVELFARYRLLADTGYLLAALDLDVPPEGVAHDGPLSEMAGKHILAARASLNKPVAQTPMADTIPLPAEALAPAPSPGQAPRPPAPVAAPLPQTDLEAEFSLAPAKAQPPAGTPGTTAPRPSSIPLLAATPGATPASTVAPSGSTTAMTAGTTDTAPIRQAVEDWAAAWSKRDVAAYLAAYAAEFRPAGKLSREAWEAQRRQRIEGTTLIRIEIDALAIEPAGDKATARFVQRYQSDKLSSTDRKVLELVRRDGRWLIAAERAIAQ